MRSLVVVGTALLTAVASLAALRAGMDGAGVKNPETKLDMAVQLSAGLRSLAAKPSLPGVPRILYVGDSTAISDPQSRSIPMRLRSILERSTDPGFQFFSLFEKGLWAADSFFLAGELARAKPDLVLLTFNPASTSPRWISVLGHPETSAWLGFDRIATTLHLPIARAGVTTDRLLFYNALVSLGATYVWQELRSNQSGVVSAWRDITARSDALLYSATDTASRDSERLSKFVEELDARSPMEKQRERYGAFLDGVDTAHPTLEFIGATVRYWSDRKIDTLVFVVPLNVEYLEDLGIRDNSGIAHSVASLRTVVEGAGGELLDLHSLLPAAAFRDKQGHLAANDPAEREGGVDGPLQVAIELERRIQRITGSPGGAD